LTTVDAGWGPRCQQGKQQKHPRAARAGTPARCVMAASNPIHRRLCRRCSSAQTAGKHPPCLTHTAARVDAGGERGGGVVSGETRAGARGGGLAGMAELPGTMGARVHAHAHRASSAPVWVKGDGIRGACTTNRIGALLHHATIHPPSDAVYASCVGLPSAFRRASHAVRDDKIEMAASADDVQPSAA
jgi:hypothetical protein